MADLNTIRFDAFWAAVRDRVRDASVTNALGLATDAARATRVYLPDDAAAAPVETQVWGRVFIVPVDTPLAFVGQGDNATRDIRFLTLVEFSPFTGAGWDIRRAMGAVQGAIFTRLQGYNPVLSRILFVAPVSLDRPAHSHPMRDVNSRMWWTSAEYVCRIAARAA